MATKAKTYDYVALHYLQRGQVSPAFVVFHASAQEVAAWADVDRLEPDNPTGAQRPLRDLKVKKVHRFLGADPRNTIPTAVVVAFDKKSVTFTGKQDKGGAGAHGALSIVLRAGSKPGLIIDGQHRVHGIKSFQPNMHLNVVGIIGGDDMERAFQFVVINNSATKVPKTHIQALNLQFDHEKLNKRLLESAGVTLGLTEQKYDDLQTVDVAEPFMHLIDWPTNRDGFVQARSIQGALAETRERANSLGIEDLERDVFLAMWQEIKSLYPKNVWARYPGSRLLLNVSIVALTVFLLETMVAKQRMQDTPIDFTDTQEIAGVVKKVLGRIPQEFWTTEWKLTELDTSSGRQTLLEALEDIDSNVRFGRPWFENLTLIDPSSVAPQSSPKKKKKVAVKKVTKKKVAKRGKA